MDWLRRMTSWTYAASHPWQMRFALAGGFFAAGVIGAVAGEFLHPWELPVGIGLTGALIGTVLGELRMRREPTYR